MTEIVGANGRVSLKQRLWQPARIERVKMESPRVKTFTLRPRDMFEFTAGQHAEVRLTAPDGYRAQRSYSISSAPDGSGTIEITIERLDDGEVSPFFHEVVSEGDEVELRGPLGGHFIWTPADAGPVLLVGGGSGVCPLVSMIRQRRMLGVSAPFALLFSARRWDEVLFRDELMDNAAAADGFSLVLTITREMPSVADVHGRRIDSAMVAEALGTLPEAPKLTFICGSNPFVETAAKGVMEAGVPAQAIKTERYGL